MARAIANLQPESANLAHGAYRWEARTLAPPCDRCVERDQCESYIPGGLCRPAQAAQVALVRDVMALEHVEERSRPVVEEYARMVVGLTIIDTYLGRVGLFSESKCDVRPVVATRDRWSARMESLANALGLTPASASRLKLTQRAGPMAQLAMALMEIEGERRARDDATIEGQFEMELEDGEDGGSG